MDFVALSNEFKLKLPLLVTELASSHFDFHQKIATRAIKEKVRKARLEIANSAMASGVDTFDLMTVAPGEHHLVFFAFHTPLSLGNPLLAG